MKNGAIRWTFWMHRALQLAALAEGQTSPNPLVGAVVLDAQGALVGEAFMPRQGKLMPRWERFLKPVLAPRAARLSSRLSPAVIKGARLLAQKR